MSYVKPQNPTPRTQMRRFARPTNACSKRRLSHYCMVVLHTVCYNFNGANAYGLRMITAPVLDRDERPRAGISFSFRGERVPLDR